MSALVMACVIVILGIARSSHELGTLEVLTNGIASAREASWSDVILTDVGIPATITTNIIRWFPDSVGWLNGQSYISSIANLLPGFFFGGSINRPFLTMAFLYKDLFEGGQFNQNIGYGFAWLGEAYANFGLVGSFITMFILGFILKLLYLLIYAQNGAKRVLAVTWYGVTLISAILSLRGESLSFLKPTLYGLIIPLIIWKLSLSKDSISTSVATSSLDLYKGYEK
jgi:hypothetical protein